MPFERTTEGIRVAVQPAFLAARSDPAEGRWVFAYRVRIENGSGQPVQLLWRHWRIHDPVAGDSEVEGEGVVGVQPRIAPGGAHEYQSFSVLRAPEGHMEGRYQLARPDGTRFHAEIPRFPLRAPPAAPPGPLQ